MKETLTGACILVQNRPRDVGQVMLEAQTLPGHKKCRLPTFYIAKDNCLSDFENFEFSPTYGLSRATQSLVVFAHCFPSVAGVGISNGN